MAYGDRLATRGFDVADDTRPVAIWTDGTTAYIVTNPPAEDAGYEGVRGYVLATGARDATKDINLESVFGLSDDDKPNFYGMWSDGTTAWFSESNTDHIYALTLATGARDSGKEFDTFFRNNTPGDIWSDGTTLWVTDRRGGRVYAYVLATGVRDADKEFDYDVENTRPNGIWSDGTRLYVSDHSDRKIYCYILATGARDSVRDFDLHDENGPQGLWAVGPVLYVADWAADRIFAYDFVYVPPLIPTDFTVVVDGRRATASWTRPATDVNVDLVFDLRWRERGVPSVYITSSSIRATSWPVDLAKYSTTYDFQVRARSATQTSAWVDADATTGAAPVDVMPGVPGNFVATVTNGRTVILNWARSDPSATHYRVRYRRNPMEGWRNSIVTNNFLILDLNWSTTYTFEVRGENGTAFSAWASVMATTDDPPIQDPDVTIDIYDGIDVVATRIWDDILEYSGKFGINRGSVDDLCESVAGQLILSNAEGKYDGNSIRPNARIHINHNIAGEDRPMLHGWVRSVQPTTNHSTGQKICTVTFAGVLVQLSREDYELALFGETVRTDDVIRDVLGHIDRADIQQRIGAGQVRIHAAEYGALLRGRTRSRPLAIIRAVEQAEVGYVHEERGDTLTFEHRYQREIDARLGLDYVFGTGDGEIRPMRIVSPDLGWNHIINRVTVGGEHSRVVAPGDIATPVEPGDALSIDARVEEERETFDLTDLNEEQLGSKYVKSVVNWSAMEADHIEVRRADTNAVVNPSFTDPDADLYITWVRKTSTSQTLYVRNDNDYGIRITKLEMHGTGVHIWGKYTYGPIEDLESQAIYDRQSRNLPTTVLSDETNHDGDVTEAARDFVNAYLSKRSKPRASGKIPFNPLQSVEATNFMANVMIGDPVTCTEPTGMPPGVYYFEGMEFSFTAYPRQLMCVAYVSQKGRSRNVVNNVADVTTSQGWAQIGARALLPNEDYIIGATIAFSGNPSDDRDDTVMRVRVRNKTRGIIGTRTVKIWAEEDIPATPAFLGVSIRENPPTLADREIDPDFTPTATIEVRQPPGSTNTAHISRWQVVRVEI